MATLLSGVFVVSVGVIAFFAWFMRLELAPLAATFEEHISLHSALYQNAFISLGIVIILLLTVFFTVGRYVAKPIQEVTTSMEAFATSGTLPGPVRMKGIPKEVKRFSYAFTALASRVEQAHKHDTEVSRMKSDFISTAAHQLRTPLTGIRWALEALEKENLTEGQKALVASAKEKSHQLVAVVGTLLDISSIESGKFKYDYKPTDLASLVDEVSRDFQEAAGKASVALLFEKSGQAVHMVRADRERIRWVLNNLLENAIRYTPQGGNVRITMEEVPGRVYVHVRDTGIGIAPEDRGNIFERFYRAPGAIAKENSGNGLGLYIARTIATDHGGELSFTANEAGPGTTFTLSLPFA